MDLRRCIINISIGDPEPHRDGIFELETSTVRVSFGSGPRKMLRFGTFALLYTPDEVKIDPHVDFYIY